MSIPHKPSSQQAILEPGLENLLAETNERSGKTRSEIALEALRRQLRLKKFERIRKPALPFLEARDYLMGEDVFEDVL